MSKGQHTPGPWIVDHSLEASLHNHVCISTDENDCRLGGHHLALAQVVWKMNGDDRTPEKEANARLIAAAPELLEALDTFCRWATDESIPSREVLEKARAAIAKARGEA